MRTVREMIGFVSEGGTMDAAASEALFDSVFEGGVSEIELSALLAAMRVRRETPEEILGAARSMRKFATRLDVKGGSHIDTCGTGGDNSHSFNISTAVALVLASLGIGVTKHGNRSVSSKSGSADFLEELGLPIDLTGDDAAQFYDRHGFVFMFAPKYHPAMRHAAPVRKALGIRTIFNFLGPITNPAFPARQMIGVFHPDFLPVYSQVVAGLGYERALLYSAEGGMDEVSPVRHTMVYEVVDERVRFYAIHPDRYISAKEAVSIPRGLSARENAALFMETVHSPRPTALGKLLAMNAALALYLSSDGDNLNTEFGAHYKKALDAIHGGEVCRKVTAMREAMEAVHAG